MNILELPFDPHSPGSCLDRQQLLAREFPRPNREDTGNDPDLEDTQPIHEWIADAWLIVWSEHMMRMADAAAGDLHQWLAVTQDLLPRKTVLWLYGTPKSQEVEGTVMMELGVLFHQDGQDLDVTFLTFSLLPNSNLGGLSTVLSMGEVPDDEDVQHLLKEMRFAQSPYISVHQGQVPRYAARRAARYGGNTQVGFINLRRALGLQDGTGERAGGDVDWQCQWPVSGHWRRQWYASDQVHRPVWIAPYIKGPPDKPFRGNPGKMMR